MTVFLKLLRTTCSLIKGQYYSKYGVLFVLITIIIYLAFLELSKDFVVSSHGVSFVLLYDSSRAVGNQYKHGHQMQNSTFNARNVSLPQTQNLLLFVNESQQLKQDFSLIKSAPNSSKHDLPYSPFKSRTFNLKELHQEKFTGM